MPGSYFAENNEAKRLELLMDAEEQSVKHLVSYDDDLDLRQFIEDVRCLRRRNGYTTEVIDRYEAYRKQKNKFDAADFAFVGLQEALIEIKGICEAYPRSNEKVRLPPGVILPPKSLVPYGQGNLQRLAIVLCSVFTSRLVSLTTASQLSRRIAHEAQIPLPKWKK